jgi:putative heme-binding domain-containing protein
MVAELLDATLFSAPHPTGADASDFQRVRAAVNDKSWFHLQDYRMLNGWYVYGGRRTWDTETFPTEFRKIRKMVAVRDQYIWDIVAGKSVPEVPDDSGTGEVFIPETMFGTRDDAFREKREPKTLVYPTPEESIAQMKVPEGMKVELFASEREFPELSNPTQIAFDSKGRLWVSCMTNYPQWLPGASKPGDKLLILEDTTGDGKADVCKTFYDKLICPTGFEFYQDGVIVTNQPRIVFLRDTDGDDVADEEIPLMDGIATDDTHHTMGAFEWSNGGLLYMLEGISMSTTLETPYGPFRNNGPSGGYIFDPKSLRLHYFRTPGYGNPWCMVFDEWGMGTVGDGTGAQQHWESPLSGVDVPQRKTLRAQFDNQGMRPAIGSEFLLSRHLPDELQGYFTYACVINMHGMPLFDVKDEKDGAGYAGKRVPDLLDSTDNFFRPVDPQIGPDGAIWFGDWCNALIGHMQYSQRDPNRDHEHGRIYRLVNTKKPLLTPVLQHGKSVEELLSQLEEYEQRTRYRARRELRSRPKAEVMAAVKKWIADPNSSPNKLCEALWLQESFRDLDGDLVNRILATDEFRARAAAVRCVANEFHRFAGAKEVFAKAITDPAPRVRLEAVRGLSFLQTAEAAEIALQVTQMPMDYWIEYTLEHTLQALMPAVEIADRDNKFLVDANPALKEFFSTFNMSMGPGGQAVKPLKDAENTELPMQAREHAISQLAGIGGGNEGRGEVVFSRVCSACHRIGNTGKEFGPRLDDVGIRYSKAEIIRHTLWPNDTIAKGYETVQVITVDGEVFSGFILDESDASLKLGVATQDGRGREVVIPKEDIENRKEMKASSMPEGLAKTIAPSEFLDLMEYLSKRNQLLTTTDGWLKPALDNSPLRTVGDLVEISREAEILYPKDFPTQWMGQSNLVLTTIGADKREFAFHSPDAKVQSPAIIIRLAEPKAVGFIKLENRRNPQFHERAKNLAVWTSVDGESWKQVWKSEVPAANYDIKLDSMEEAKYIKVGLDGQGVLHLNQISLYGK